MKSDNSLIGAVICDYCNKPIEGIPEKRFTSFGKKLDRPMIGHKDCVPPLVYGSMEWGSC